MRLRVLDPVGAAEVEVEAREVDEPALAVVHLRRDLDRLRLERERSKGREDRAAAHVAHGRRGLRDRRAPAIHHVGVEIGAREAGAGLDLVGHDEGDEEQDGEAAEDVMAAGSARIRKA